MSADATSPPQGRRRGVSIKSAAVLAIASVVLLGAGWAGFRYLDYRSEEPLRRGIGALKEGKYAEARANITPFARNGNRLARELMSMMHARGFGVPVDNIRAQIWIRRAECNCGVPGITELNLAHGFLEGTPAPKDPSRALYWLQRAAEAGNSDAQRLLTDSDAATRRGLVVPPETVEFWRQYLKQPE